MAEPLVGTCEPWATEADLCSPCNDYEVLGPIAGDFLQIASDVLYELSGRQFRGECEQTVRPCVRPSQCRCGGDCACMGVRQVELGAHPVTSIVTVKVDGDTLASDRYRVDDYRWLVRLPDADGINPGWPTRQNLDLSDTEDDTWSVTFRWGTPVPALGVTAAAVLACELALACDPENAGECRLPKKVSTITREGVTMILSPSDFLTDGKTGLYEVDLFLGTYNAKRLQRRATAWSPDTVPLVRRAT